MGIILLPTMRKTRLGITKAPDETLPHIVVSNAMGTSDYVRNGIVNHSLTSP